MKIIDRRHKPGQPRIFYEFLVNGELHRIGTQHRLYNLRYKMIQRCYHSKAAEYNAYQGKGIQVCQEWRDNPESFFEWCLSSGWQNGLQLDRIDPDGNYEPSNVQISTISENARRSLIGKIGENSRNFKLDAEKVRQIKVLFSKNISCYRIAKDFGLARSTIANIKSGKTWSHVTLRDHYASNAET